MFDLDSYNITVGTDKVIYAENYEVNGYGTTEKPAEIVTVGQDNYATENTLTVYGSTSVILNDIYNSLRTTDGSVEDETIQTKLVTTGSGDANIKTISINSLGTIEIGENSTLVFNQVVEEQVQANALKFFSIKGKNASTSNLKVEGGTLLAYLQNTYEEDPISGVNATYKEGSVRTKFETNTNDRFKDAENSSTQLYRISFSLPMFYSSYKVEYTDDISKKTTVISSPLTSDKKGEIHLWLPKGTKGTAKFTHLTEGPTEISFSAVAENDDNIAPASIGLYSGDQISANNKIGVYNTLAAAFNAMESDKNYTVGLLASHSESNTNCKVPDKQQVTINLNGHNLSCQDVTFTTDANNFLLTTNNSNAEDDRHSVISGDIVVSQNVYIGKNVHMDGIHVDMLETDGSNTKNVRRVLVKGLTYNDSYTYEYANQSVEFTVKQKTTESPEEGIACLWLVESMYPQEFVIYPKKGGKALTVPGGELAVTAHSNGYIELVESGVVASIGETSYKTLSAAIHAANESSTATTIQLLTDIVSQATFDITKSYSINLNGHNLSFTQGGFNVKEGETLTIKGANSNLTGVINLKGKGTVKVEEDVLIGGVVMMHSDEEIKTVYRLIVDEGTDTSQNVWVETPERNTDVQYGTDPRYEYTIPAGLANHQTKVKGYKVVTIKGSESVDDVKDCNVVVNDKITWKPTGEGTIHRLTIHEGGKVETSGETKITATDDIRYVRSFTKNQWTLIALPFTSTDITTKIEKKVVSLSPAANPGTAGHFWLQTIKNDGSTTDVTSGEMTANQVYIMAVPESLNNEDITFISGPNQMLNRDKVLNPNPISGFVAYANGTLDDVILTKQFYKLNAAENKFERVDEPEKELISPFSDYLLADKVTTETVASFGLRSTPTANEEIEVTTDKLQIRTQPGRIILTANEPMQVIICDMAGVVKFYGEIPAGDSSYEVGAGTHIVNTQKVIVR